MENLKNSAVALQTLSLLVDLLVNKQKITLDSAWAEVDKASYLTLLIDQVKANADKTAQKTKTELQILTTITRNRYYQKPELFGGSSDVYKFDTRNSLQISPDFGYTVYGFQKGFTGFAPYLGFHVNFRYIDKDIPFSIFSGLNRYPNKTLWHYLSFMTAWTLTSIDEGNKRENFFDNGALATGLGLRISNAIRITAGNFWFYKLDQRPEIKARKLAITPFVGLSLDLSLKSLVNDITSLKPTKP